MIKSTFYYIENRQDIQQWLLLGFNSFFQSLFPSNSAFTVYIWKITDNVMCRRICVEYKLWCKTDHVKNKVA